MADQAFKVSSGPVTVEQALALADKLESALEEILNGRRKPGMVPMEPMVKLIQFARDVAADRARSAKALEGESQHGK